MPKDRYETKIDALIPMAEKEARQRVRELGIGKSTEKRPGRGGVFYNHCLFTEFFHRSMKRLAIEAGLRTF